jgi:hypothetical protein
VNAVDSGKAPSLGYRTLGNWMRAHLTTQGYCLDDDERRRLAVALRFSTGTCLLLVLTALALESPAMIFALTGVGLIAGLTSRHPFDLVRNHVVRHVAGGPALPRNPTRRRHAFKIATVWLLVVGTPFCRRREHRRADPRRPARRGLRNGHHHQLLHPLRAPGAVGATKGAYPCACDHVSNSGITSRPHYDRRSQ